MNDPLDSANLGRAAVIACLVFAVVLLVPLGLAAGGVGALAAVLGGRVPTPSITIQAPPGVPTGASSAIGDHRPPPAGGPDAPTAAGGLRGDWAARPALNQYSRTNYRSEATWLAWRDADCSATALAWLLGAYGQPLASLDDAIALVGPSTGISTRLGLLDARGTALARALAERGLTPRTPGARPLATIADLRAWLDSGPLLMDGGRWFGVGHWFVGIGYDAGGVFIRDSSGWDTRYLSWSRLYSEVGFSGWVVGVV
jgi:hypothetical protein